MFKKKVLAALLSACLAQAAFSSTASVADTTINLFPIAQGDSWESPYYVFTKFKGEVDGRYHGWRLPAITNTAQGTLVAVADARMEDADLPNAVFLGVRVSADNGNTWFDVNLVRPEPILNPMSYWDRYNWQSFSSRAQVVSNPKTGSTFIFAMQSYSDINVSQDMINFLMFKSTDGGRSWDTGINLLPIIQPNNYGSIFQGTGNGLFYNDKIYVAIQQWGKPYLFAYGNGDIVSTTGIMYSADDGKSWQTSVLVDNIHAFQNGTAVLPDGSNVSETSNPSIFLHKGYIYLSSKTENAQDPLRRVTFRTKDDGKTWERVREDFLPDNMADCQTSSYSLSDNIYLVGYSVSYPYNPAVTSVETYITTNTGRKVLVAQNPVAGGYVGGYSSISVDQDNIYVFAEGPTAQAHNGVASVQNDPDGSVFLKRFDISAKEYANINGQLLRSAQDLFYLQEQMNLNQTYVSASYGGNLFGFEGVFALDKLHFGAFYKEDDDLSEDVHRTVAYDAKTLSLLAGYQGLLFDTDLITDHIYAGYQYSKAEYINASETDVHSLVLGYGLNLKTDYLDYEFAFNGSKGDHDFDRNRHEGLGKHASFGSYTFGFKNELSKSFEIVPSYLTVKPYVGIENIYFKHDSFTESYANGFNEFTINENSAWSHLLYAGAKASGSFSLDSNVDLFYEGNLKLATQLADEDDWIDTFVVLDDRFSFARPLDEQNDVIVSGQLKVGLDIYKQLRISLAASRDNFEENRIAASVRYAF